MYLDIYSYRSVGLTQEECSVKPTTRPPDFPGMALTFLQRSLALQSEVTVFKEAAQIANSRGKGSH